MSFKDKVVVITGAASGVGAATAIKFSEEGASVVLVDKQEAKVKHTALKCPKSLAIVADLTNDDDLQVLIDKTIKKFSKIDILVNNAGIMATGTILGGNLMNSYTSCMNLNLRANILLVTLAAPYLIKTKGNIVNISSATTQIPYTTPMLSMYSVSKAALKSFTVLAASELAAQGVRVNSISPGPINTEIMQNSQVNIPIEELKIHTALNRICEPGEISDLIMYLASDKARGITGSNFMIDNGYLLRNN